VSEAALLPKVVLALPQRRSPPIGHDQRQDTRAPGAAEGMEQQSGTAEDTASPQASAAGLADAGPSSGDATITLTVNGETRPCPSGLMLPQVLEALGYRPQLVVVEFNGEILPRQRWPQQPVGESDVLEVVTIVGGGS